MQATISAVRPTVGVAYASGPFGWRALTQVSGGLAAVALVLTAVGLGDREAAGLAVLTVLGMALARRGNGLLGLLLLAAIFVATLAFMLPGAAFNLARGHGLLAYLVPLTLATLSSAGLVGALAAVRSRARTDAGRDIAPWVALSLAVAFAIALGAGLVRTRGDTGLSTPNELSIAARTNTFSVSTLTAEPGRVAIRFANNDLFWHTFSIDALGVDLRVPVNAEEKISFVAPAGTYEFYCAIPGHALIGMKGTLVVQ
jgi:plastocyanin